MPPAARLSRSRCALLAGITAKSITGIDMGSPLSLRLHPACAVALCTAHMHGLGIYALAAKLLLFFSANCAKMGADIFMDLRGSHTAHCAGCCGIPRQDMRLFDGRRHGNDIPVCQ